MRAILPFVLALISAPAFAQSVAAPAPETASKYSTVIRMDIPVIAGDIADRPYRVVATVKTEVRPAIAIDGPPSEAKVFEELWERGAALGADAVIKAKYSGPRVTLFSWNSRKATGTAIKFLTDEEISGHNSHTPAPVVTPAPK